MKTSIIDKVALITGGLGGLASMYAKELMINGIRGIALVDVETTKSVETVKELERCGKGNVLFIKADVNIFSQLTGAFEAALKEFQQLDIFINNAGILDEARWQRMITTNLIAGFTANQLAMRKYLAKHTHENKSTIVNTICVTSIRPLASLAVYSSIKWGLLGMHRALSNRYWYETYHCRFLALCPGLTRTRLLKNLYSKGIDLDLFDEECCEIPMRRPDNCGDCLINALQMGKHGSIWVCEGSETYEWIPPDRYEVRRLMREEENKNKTGHCK